MRQLQTLGWARLAGAGALVALIIVALVFMLHSANVSAGSGDIGPVTSASPAIHHGPITEYPMPFPKSDLMYPAVDAQGNVWAGEMGRNRLARLDPATQTITEWAPPGSQYGIMGVTTDKQGNIWFAEENASFIGRLNPTNGQFTNYPLPKHDGKPAAPVTIAFAPDGVLWFSQVGNDCIGSLNPATGAIKTYPLPIPDPQSPPAPYGVAVDQAGIVWFTELGGGGVGRVDPATGTVQVFPLPRKTIANAIAVAPDGVVWFTEMSNDQNQGVLGRVDPHSFAISEIALPTQYGKTAELYDIKVTPDGGVWLTSSGANRLFRYDPAAQSWTSAALPTPNSIPLGLALGPHGQIWFTEGGEAANRFGEYQS